MTVGQEWRLERGTAIDKSPLTKSELILEGAWHFTKWKLTLIKQKELKTSEDLRSIVWDR